MARAMASQRSMSVWVKTRSSPITLVKQSFLRYCGDREPPARFRSVWLMAALVRSVASAGDRKNRSNCVLDKLEVTGHLFDAPGVISS